MQPESAPAQYLKVEHSLLRSRAAHGAPSSCAALAPLRNHLVRLRLRHSRPGQRLLVKSLMRRKRRNFPPQPWPALRNKQDGADSLACLLPRHECGRLPPAARRLRATVLKLTCATN